MAAVLAVLEMFANAHPEVLSVGLQPGLIWCAVQSLGGIVSMVFVYFPPEYQNPYFKWEYLNFNVNTTNL
jgi:hypothetical protein